MKCSKCGIDLRIQSAYDETVYDNGNEYTYRVSERMCPNPRCEAYLSIVDIDRKITGVIDVSDDKEVI